MPNVPSEILIPEESWQERSAYVATARKLADLFIKNFLIFESGVSAEVKAARTKVILEIAKLLLAKR